MRPARAQASSRPTVCAQLGVLVLFGDLHSFVKVLSWARPPQQPQILPLGFSSWRFSHCPSLRGSLHSSTTFY